MAANYAQFRNSVFMSKKATCKSICSSDCHLNNLECALKNSKTAGLSKIEINNFLVYFSTLRHTHNQACNPNFAKGRAKSTDRDKLTAHKLTTNKLTAKQRFRYSDFVAVISSQSEGLSKMALGIVEIYFGSPFSANRHCSRPVCSRSVCRG